jgi:amidophosphoribosyltransferase
MVAATQVGKQALCRACFDGIYPVELPLIERLGKSILEETAADLEPVVSGVGAADALLRP